MKWRHNRYAKEWYGQPEPKTANACIRKFKDRVGYVFDCIAGGVFIQGPARTLKEAKANCEHHAERYGRKP